MASSRTPDRSPPTRVTSGRTTASLCTNPSPPRSDPGVHSRMADNHVALTIDGYELSVPKGTLLIRAAEQLQITIPRFCDHPLLAPVAACRQCLVEIEG